MTIVLLIRHATNDWVKGRLAGWTPGVFLNEQGRQQAHALAQRLQSLPIQAFYSSPLERAVETAETIAAPHQQSVSIVEGVGEVRYGEWNGTELKELTKHELWPGVQHYPSGTRFPGGETLGEVQMRAVQALDDLRSRHAEHDIIAVVSHADVIKLVVSYYIGMHIDLFQRLVINPASLTAFAFHPMGPRMLAYNECGSFEHLRPPEPDQTEPEQETEQADSSEHGSETVS